MSERTCNHAWVYLEEGDLALFAVCSLPVGHGEGHNAAAGRADLRATAHAIVESINAARRPQRILELHAEGLGYGWIAIRLWQEGFGRISRSRIAQVVQRAKP